MPLSDVIRTALDQIQHIAKTETVIGEPIIAGSVTLIPVSKVSIGFAAGGAGKEEKSGSGAATGGGVTVTPVAFVSIVGDRVQVVPVSKKDPDLVRLFTMAPDLLRTVARILGKEEGECKGSDPDTKRSQATGE